MTTMSLAEMVTLLTPQSPEDRAELAKMRNALYAGFNRETLIELGNNIASAHVLRDAKTVFGQAVTAYRAATTEQQNALVACNPMMLALAVESAIALENILDRKTGALNTDRSAVASAEATTKLFYQQGMRKRAFLTDQLEKIHHNDPAQLAALSIHKSRIDTEQDLQDSMKALHQFTKQVLEQGSEAVKARAALFGITPAYLDGIQRWMAQFSDALIESSRRQTASLLQGEIDWQDGVVLFFLKHVVDAFDYAREEFETIPRLELRATRAVFGRASRKKAVENAPIEPITPVAIPNS